MTPRAVTHAVAGIVSVYAPPSAVASSIRIPAANPPVTGDENATDSVVVPAGFTHGTIKRGVKFDGGL